MPADEMDVTIPAYPDGDHPECGQAQGCGNVTRTCERYYPPGIGPDEEYWRYMDPGSTEEVSEAVHLWNRPGPQGKREWEVTHYYNYPGDDLGQCKCRWRIRTAEDLHDGGSAPRIPWGNCSPSTGDASWQPS